MNSLTLGRSLARSARAECSCARRPRRRPQSTASSSSSSAPKPANASWPDCQDDVSVQLREVMRNVAQPVAVAVARVPASVNSPSKYHGATLTSFTSLTLHPYPLVAFSLRLPSRMADCLRPWATNRRTVGSGRRSEQADPAAEAGEEYLEPTLLSASGTGDATRSSRSARSVSNTPFDLDPEVLSHPDASASKHPPIPLTVSLLSTSNTPVADALSRYSPDQSVIFADPEWTGGALSSEGVSSAPPSIRSAIGALRCEVVQSVPLRDLCEVSSSEGDDRSSGLAGPDALGPAHHGSELFICRVLGVEKRSEGSSPLLHYQQRYVGVADGDEAA